MSVFPVFWRYASLEDIARHIIAGDRFKTKMLEELEPAVEATEQEPLCNPKVSQAAAIVQLRMLEQALADDEDESIDPRMASLQKSIHRALSCSPADPFLWLVLYWVEVNRSGYRSGDLEYLRMSYALGPNEGWIALKRNGLALAIFNQLPSAMRKMATREFASLLNSGFVNEAATILTGPGWPVRAELLPGLKDVKDEFRDEFARTLYHDGYNVAVPGVRLPSARPWD